MFGPFHEIIAEFLL